MHSILIISPFFFPEPISSGKYNTVLAQALANRGCKVTVLCSYPVYPQWSPRKTCAELPDISTVRGGLWVRYSTSMILRRLILELWFSAHVVISGLRLRNKFDCIIPIFPPNLHFLLAVLVLGRRPKRIGIVHDLQSIHASARAKGVTARVIRFLIEFIENRTFKTCDRIVALSHSMSNVIIKAIDPSRVTVCYPFPTLSYFSPIKGKLAESLPSGRIHVVYSGALGGKQMPDDFLLFLQAAAKRMPHVWFHIFSEGRDFDIIRRQTLFQKNLFFHPLVAESDLVELYERSDVQIVPQAAGTESGAMPSKLPNIVVSGCPVFAICAADSELAELIKSYDLGVVASEWHEACLIKCMEKFIESELPDWKMRKNSERRQNAINKFDIDALVNMILNQAQVNLPT